jgi:hypothetical protein
MSSLPDIDSRAGMLVRYALVLFCAFIFNEIGDHVSAFFVSFTFYISGLSTLIGYVLSGLLFGWILHYLFRNKVRTVILVLPLFMLLASLLVSMYLFIDQERVFRVSNWLTYMVSSGHGLRFIYIAIGAYLSQLIIGKYSSK